jgi:transposase
MTYPLALRQLAVEKVRQKEMTQAQAAKFFKIGITTLKAWLTAKTLNPKTKRTPRTLKVSHPRLLAILKEAPDATLKEIAYTAGVSDFCIRYHFKLLKITRKKKRPCTSNEMKKNDKFISRILKNQTPVSLFLSMKRAWILFYIVFLLVRCEAKKSIQRFQAIATNAFLL